MNPDVSILGHGVRLRAEGGAELGWLPSNDGSLIGAWIHDDKLHNCVVSVRDGVATIHAGAKDELVGFALEPDASAADAWRIELPSYSCIWPVGIKLRVLPNKLNRWEFELADRGEGVIFLRGPLRGASVPAPDQLIGPTQEVVASDMGADAMWVELRYEHGGKTWRQRHQYAVPAPEVVVLVTAQAPEGTELPLFELVAAIAKSIRLKPEPRRSL